VITAATAGAGRAVVEQFARNARFLPQLSRSAPRLELQLCDSRERYSVTTLAIASDVADAEVVEAAADRLGIPNSRRSRSLRCSWAQRELRR
jgi:short-subunit dehydrogenase